MTGDGAGCCTPAAQAACCSAAEKAGCCGDGGCGCAAGARDAGIRERVRERYAAAAPSEGASTTVDSSGRQVFGAALYGDEAGADGDAVGSSLGCGVPTAVADLHPGEVVLDLGSGGGADVLISARRVGPAGRAIGST